MRLTLEQIKEKSNNDILFLINSEITEIEAFPDTLKKIHVSDNLLKTLPALPAELKELYCYNNQISELPILPPELQKLDCSNNPCEDISFDKSSVTHKVKNTVNCNTDYNDEDDNSFDDIDDDFDIEYEL